MVPNGKYTLKIAISLFFIVPNPRMSGRAWNLPEDNVTNEPSPDIDTHLEPLMLNTSPFGNAELM